MPDIPTLLGQTMLARYREKRLTADLTKDLLKQAEHQELLQTEIPRLLRTVANQLQFRLRLDERFTLEETLDWLVERAGTIRTQYLQEKELESRTTQPVRRVVPPDGGAARLGQ